MRRLPSRTTVGLRASVVFALVLAVCPGELATASGKPPLSPPTPLERASVARIGAGVWEWPLAESRVAAAYRQPADRYAAGHRGIDLRAEGELDVRAPDDGVVAFTGEVAGRPLMTIDHGSGLVSTLEPVVSELLPGDLVTRGAVVGRLAVGGHVDPGDLHVGARLDGEYINPLALLGGIPRAVLLPCC